MNKTHLVSFGVIVLVALGCTQSKVDSYLDNPVKMIQDPHYTSYSDKKTELESRYLAKEITYAEYLEKRKEIDKQYIGEVQHRENILSDDY